MTVEGPSSAWQLRRAVADDVAAMMELERATFTTDAWSERSMFGEVTGEHTCYFVAFPHEEQRRIVAYAGLFAPRGSEEGDIQTIAVAPQARRHGLGRTLMLALIGEARKRAVREVFLEVRSDNHSAQSLYRTLGFREIGVRAKYYQPDGADALVMRLAVPNPEASLV